MQLSGTERGHESQDNDGVANVVSGVWLRLPLRFTVRCERRYARLAVRLELSTPFFCREASAATRFQPRLSAEAGHRRSYLRSCHGATSAA